MLILATTADLASWVNPVPPGADRLLRKASVLVRRATRLAVYDVDSAGKPRDPEVIAAFRDATCAQAAYWDENGIDPGSLPTPVIGAKSMGGRSATIVNAAEIAAAQAASNAGLIPEAMLYLSDAGLTGGQPSVGYRYGW